MAKFDFMYFSTNDGGNFNKLKTFNDFYEYFTNFTKINEVILNNLILIDDKNTARLFKLIKIIKGKTENPDYIPSDYDYMIVYKYLWMPFLIDEE